MMEYVKEIELFEEDDIEDVSKSSDDVSSVESVEPNAVTEDNISYKDINIAEEHDAAVAGSRNGKAQFCFITTGQGTSGYYTEDVLRKAVHLFEGRPMFIDHHRGKSDPGILYWAGDIESAHFDARGIDGAGIYGTASVLPRYKDVVQGMVDSRGGVSIKAKGQANERGVIHEITAVESVDYVVRAGRGGRVMELFESAIAPEILQESKESEEDIMENIEKEKEGVVEEGAVSESDIMSKVIKEVQENHSNTEIDKTFDVASVKKLIAEAINQKFESYEARLGLMEREATDREIIRNAIKEAAGDLFTEDMCKHAENMVWRTRGAGVDLLEQSKFIVESLKPVVEHIMAEADKKIEESKKEVASKSVPTILERMNTVYAGKPDSELNESDLEKELANSIAGVIETNNVDAIHETIINSRGE